jgi:diaminohydroxyphosphoribosylaminopyrimidine deaminase/5-amino-6-(5-phosphoribosylamino)uracil reductase
VSPRAQRTPRAAPGPRPQAFFAAALRLAERGRGRTSPNPVVGALVVRGGRVVGAGFHRALGGPHAEVEALRAAGPRARGATLYVTLEPCNHQGRTPPCTEALLAAGIRRVVYGVADPDTHGRTRGALRLRRAGVRVEEAPPAEAAACARALAGYVSRLRRGRPLVTVKVALTLDGRVATRTGHARWITGEAARAHGRLLRARADAVVTGAGTVRADDPLLTARDAADRPAARQPLRVIVDARARTSPRARLFRAAGPVLVAVTAAAPAAALRALAGAGAELLVLPAAPGAPRGRPRVSLPALLGALAARGCNDVLVEAGPTLDGALLAAGLADRLALYVAPKLLGSDALPAFALPGPARADAATALAVTRTARLGQDLLLEADVL